MRRRMLFGLVLVAVVALVSVAALADDSYLATPHATAGPHFSQCMVVRNDLKGSEAKPQAPPVIPSKALQLPESSNAGIGKGIGRMSTGSVLMATASPQMVLENHLRSLALEMR